MKNIILITVLLFTFHYSRAFTGKEKNLQNNIDSLITEYISDINADSISSTIQSLENFGQRFAFSPNQRDVAVWIKNKYISLGYPNAVVDSFLQEYSFGGGQVDSIWQYNVIATVTGSDNPDIIYVIGGHFDSVDWSNPGGPAPGADDNASGTAAAIEVARVFKKKGYHPKSTILFTAYGGEELGLWGSAYYAAKLKQEAKNIRMMINNDMIANSTSGTWILDFQNYTGSEWVTRLAKNICLNHSSIIPFDVNENSAGSDSYSFFENGYSTIFFIENEFSPYYHSANDLLINCNKNFCAEVVKISCGMLLAAEQNPLVFGLRAIPQTNDIKVSWNKNREHHLAGYNIYRRDMIDTSYIKLNSSTLSVNDTIFNDATVVPLNEYIYTAVTVDNLDQESIFCDPDTAMIMTFNQGILVVDDSKNEYLSPPDSVVDHFYDSLLTGYTYTQVDALNGGNISLSELGKYSTILWHTDRYTSSSKLNSIKNNMKKYLEYGGNLLLTAERLSATTDRNLGQYKSFSSGTFTHDLIKTDSIYRNPNSKLFGAISAKAGYPSMNIDTLKTPVANMHHLSLIEEIIPSAEANIIYKYDSKYDSTSLSGCMKGLPVGIEYLGNDFHLVALSFPLYYMKYDEARPFIKYVMENVFAEPNSVPENSMADNFRLLPCFPNPFSSSTTIRYYLPAATHVSAEVFNSMGQKVTDLVNQFQNEGLHFITFNAFGLGNGIYYCIIKTDTKTEQVKMVLMK
ncbi:MAG: M20/M25/M40 family metallo-hydrolase [Bacteroidia bacterium]|nr:M20/M25/M40 family metallo-hydrolase [Bacteroidia bacterium]